MVVRFGQVLLVLACLVLTCPGTAFGKKPPMVVRHFSTTDGLPVGSAAAALADADGFLWIATHDGLARFDGHDFELHDVERAGQSGGNRFVALVRDGHGNVLARSADGALVRARGGSVTPVIGPGPRAEPVTDALFLQADASCITRRSGVDCVAANGKLVREVVFEPGMDVRAAFRAAPGRFWLLDPAGGVLLKSGRAPAVRVGGDNLLSTGPEHIVARVDGRGNLWAATRGGVVRASLDGRVVFMQPPTHSPAEVVQIRIDRAGRAWVGGDGGLYRAAGDGSRMENVSVQPTLPEGAFATSWEGPDGSVWVSHAPWLYRDGQRVLAPGGAITDISFDREGTAWVSTLRDGLYALSLPRVDVLGTAEGLRSDNIYGMAIGPDGRLWAGSLGGGLHAMRRDGAIEHYDRAQGLPGDNVRAVAVASDGTVFAASYAPGLYRLAPGEALFEPVPLPPPAAKAQVLSITFDRGHRPWIGTTDGAWRREATRWRRAWPLDKAGHASIGAILHAADGSTWFGSNLGLYRAHHGATAEVAVQLLGGHAIRDLFQDSTGRVWASTEGHGLVQIDNDDPTGVHARRLGRAEGLPTNSPHAVLQDAQGNLWVNSNQGIHRITRDWLAKAARGGTPPLSPLTLGVPDGLVELEGNGGVQPAAARDRDGVLWFPTQRGIVRVDPANLPMRPNLSRTVIDRVSDLATGAELALPGPLAPEVRSIGIRYSAADLHGGQQRRFRHRLLPVQPGWTAAESPGSAALMGLHPGRYRFEVVAGNADGVWFGKATVVAFTVSPHWYETRWFTAACLLACACAIALFVRWRMGELRLRTALLDRKVLERTQALTLAKTHAESALSGLADANDRLEQNNLTLATQAERLEGLDAFRTRLLADIGHELRTPLMLIGVSLREIEAEDALPESVLRRRIHQSLRQVDRLEGLVDQLVQLVLAEARQIELDFAWIEPDAFVRDTMAAFLPMARRNALAFDVETGEGTPRVLADAKVLTTILSNLVSNACHHAPRGSVVRARVMHDAESGYVRITIMDAGPGVPDDVARHMFDRFYRGEGREPWTHGRGMGIGLALARELVQLHGGRIAADASGVAHGGAGVWIELPTGTAHVGMDEIASASHDAADGSPASSTQVEVRAGASPRIDRHSGDGQELLLIEDHDGLAGYLEERLSEWMNVRRVRSATEAWPILAEGTVAVVLADVVLPGESGLVLCRKLRADARHDAIPVVLMSARSTPGDRREGLSAGAAEWLGKPFSFEQLLAVIQRTWPAVAGAAKQHEDARARAMADPLIAVATARLADSAFGVSAWADAVHLSERQLRRRVVELTGTAPQAWIREQRLERVRLLVRTGQCRTLAQAGTQAGFDNADYLYRLYRARYPQHDANSG